MIRAVALSLGVALLAASCGGGKSAPPLTHSVSVTTAATPANPNAFPVLRVAEDTAIDYLDPGLAYFPESWNIIWNVYLPLLGYKHEGGPGGATIVPYLAQRLPTISRDGKTYTLVLRQGLKYSNGAPVLASDFKATIERDFKFDSPGTGLFANIVDADRFLQSKRGHIAGIVTDDTTGRITITLRHPQGDFENVLASEFAAPVPASAPAQDMSIHPLPSTGPYVLRSYKPGRQVIETRNPHFDAAALGGNVPRGNPDQIVWDIVGNAGVALQRTIAGKDDWDPQPIPAKRLAAIRAKHGDQLKVFTTPNTYYFFMNVRVAPFGDVRVRRAVNYAIDRSALASIYGGLAVPTENILPPAYPQFRAHSLYPYAPAKAKRLIRAAGARGARVTVWTDDSALDAKATDYLVSVLNSIGLVAKSNVIGSANYWSTVGNEATKAQIGFADWFQDYPHPLDWFGVLLNGDQLAKRFNSNYAGYDSAAVNSRIRALRSKTRLTPAVNRQWAALDEQVMEDAPWAPFVNREFTDFFNGRVDLGCYENHILYGFDYSTICVQAR